MLKFDLNVLDIAILAVAILTLVAAIAIAVVVRRRESRDIVREMLWSVTSDHWRTAVALLENKWEPNKVPAEEVAKRKVYLNRTVRQIKMLDGNDSGLAGKLAAEFEAIVETDNGETRPTEMQMKSLCGTLRTR